MARKLFFLAILFFSTKASIAQDKDSIQIKNIADEILTHSGAYENLRHLTKQIGPRLSGSKNAQAAVTFTAKILKEAGADTVYLQPCMVPHWERGAKETGYIIPGGGSKKYNLRLLALGNSVGTGPAGVSGSIVEVSSMAALAALGTKVKGKIVFFNIAMNPTYVRTFRAYGEAGVGRRSGPSEAARYGAVGVMVRSLASNIDTFPHTGATQYNDSFPKIPAVAISTVDAEWLSQHLNQLPDVA